MIKFTDYQKQKLCDTCHAKLLNVVLAAILLASWGGILLYAFGQMDKCPTMKKIERVKK